MKTVVILGSRPVEAALLELVGEGDTIIAADAGWQRAEALGLCPDIVLGDFDSSPKPDRPGLLVTPAEKDDTDTMLAVKKALELGAERVVLLGCLGGRPDHSYANMQALQYLAGRGVHNLMADTHTRICCAGPGELRLERLENTYVSVFAVGGGATGVNLEGLKYPLRNHTLCPDMPLGTSNEFAADTAVVRHKTGFLLVMVTEKDT